METLKQQLLELVILLGHLSPIQLKALCQFVQASPSRIDGEEDNEWVRIFHDLFQRASPLEVDKIWSLGSKQVQGSLEDEQQIDSAIREIGGELRMNEKEARTVKEWTSVLVAI